MSKKLKEEELKNISGGTPQPILHKSYKCNSCENIFNAELGSTTCDKCGSTDTVPYK